MKASDTKLKPKELVRTKHFSKTNTDIEASLAKQHEISFMAGVRKIVEWIEKNKTPCIDWEASPYQERENVVSTLRIPHEAFSIRNSEWQSKINEWLYE